MCVCARPHRDKCFISKGYDATTHFETTVEDVLEMYKRITGGGGWGMGVVRVWG